MVHRVPIVVDTYSWSTYVFLKYVKGMLEITLKILFRKHTQFTAKFSTGIQHALSLIKSRMERTRDQMRHQCLPELGMFRSIHGTSIT
jgi:hypothetical protein